MADDIVRDAVCAASAEIASNTYNDLLRPTMAACGELLKLFPQSLLALATPIRQCLAKNQATFAKFCESLNEKTEKIPPDDRVPAEPCIAVPALQALSYLSESDEIREMFANLLAASVNRNEKWKIHPAFVDMIKQMAPDEARMLRYIKEQNLPIPLVDVVFSFKDNSQNLIESNLSIFSILPEIENRQESSTMISNLLRLALLEIPSLQRITNDTAYAPIMESAEVKKWLNKKREDGIYECVKKAIRLTPLGVSFCNMCLPNSEKLTFSDQNCNISITADFAPTKWK